MEIRTVGVVGAGTMGHGIAQVALQNGLRVILRDVEDRILQQARARIEKGFDRLVEAGKIGEGQKAESMKAADDDDLADLKNADFIVEAATEDFAVKKAIFQELDRHLPSVHHSGHQHLLHLFRHQDRGDDPAAREGDRNALHESRCHPAAGGGHPRRGDVGGDGASRTIWPSASGRRPWRPGTSQGSWPTGSSCR